MASRTARRWRSRAWDSIRSKARERSRASSLRTVRRSSGKASGLGSPRRRRPQGASLWSRGKAARLWVPAALRVRMRGLAGSWRASLGGRDSSPPRGGAESPDSGRGEGKSSGSREARSGGRPAAVRRARVLSGVISRKATRENSPWSRASAENSRRAASGSDCRARIWLAWARKVLERRRSSSRRVVRTLSVTSRERKRYREDPGRPGDPTFLTMARTSKWPTPLGRSRW